MIVPYRKNPVTIHLTPEEKVRVKKFTIVTEWMKNINFYRINDRTIATYGDKESGVMYVIGIVTREKNTAKSRSLEMMPVPSYEYDFVSHELKKLSLERRDPFDPLVSDIKFWKRYQP